MTHRRGASAKDYGAPLLLAWQLTNACRCRCLHCCEESGKAWPDELSRREALDAAKQIVQAGIPYVVFGGGEPLAVAHFWEIGDILHQGGVCVKIETDGILLDSKAVERLKAWNVSSIQISLDGASSVSHERLRLGGSFAGAAAALKALVTAGLCPEVVFAPTRLNIAHALAVYDLAVELGARAFVTGPLMRLGRAAADWGRLGPEPDSWRQTVCSLQERAGHHGGKVRLVVYPWDILKEIRIRRKNPQAMMLVVPNGRTKLLNALPFAPGDLRRQRLPEAWDSVRRAWHSPHVSGFIDKVLKNPPLLRHANECWMVGQTGTKGPRKF